MSSFAEKLSMVVRDPMRVARSIRFRSANHFANSMTGKRIHAASDVLKIYRSLIKDYGQYRGNVAHESRDSSGKALPWITYPAIEYLKNLDFSGRRVMEYGSGLSTHFWAERAESVVSVESNQQWYERTKVGLPDNVTYKFAQNEKHYVSVVESHGGFDVIVIDGCFRLACAKIAHIHLNPGGLIVLDNSDWHPKCAALLGENPDFLRVDLAGFGPQLARAWVTSIYLRRDMAIPFLLPSPPVAPGGYFMNYDS